MKVFSDYMLKMFQVWLIIDCSIYDIYRKEVQILKQDQSIESLKKGSSFENKLQNDEVRIPYLF